MQQNHNGKMNKRTSEVFFRKICTSHFSVRVWKGLLRVLLWDGVGDRTELQYFDPTLMAISVVSFSFSRCSTGGLGAHSAGFLYYILSATSLDPNSSGPQGPPPPGFLYHILSSNSCNLQLPLLVLTELCNSSSPTQSLEWHVWSSSSGNNCHAVQRSLFSGVSVYECTMGFFPCPISSAKHAYAISSHNCHWNVSLPAVASPWNGKFGRIEGQNTTYSCPRRLSAWPYLLTTALRSFSLHDSWWVFSPWTISSTQVHGGKNILL